MTSEEAYWAGIGPEDFREDEPDYDDPLGILRADRDAEVEALEALRKQHAWKFGESSVICLKCGVSRNQGNDKQECPNGSR